MSVNDRTELTVKPWRPSTAPGTQSDGDVAAQLRYLYRELERLQATVASLVDAAPQATDAAPLTPRNGMIRYGEGAWGTSLVGQGGYIRDAGAWYKLVHLDSAAGIDIPLVSTGIITTGYSVSTGNAAIELGGGRTGDGHAFIDFHSTAGSDFNFRILRQGGANANTEIVHVGTGNMIFETNGGTIAGYFDNIQTFHLNTTFTSAWNLDCTGPTVVVANGTHANIPAGAGLLLVNEQTNSDTAVYLVGGTGVVLLGTSNSLKWVAPTTTPAAGKMSVAWSGTNYAVYNNAGASETVRMFNVRCGSG